MYKHIHVIHQNTDGLISKSDLLSLHINDLANLGKHVDVLCVTEHNMTQEDHYNLCIPNYTLATFYARKSRRGGSCILVNNKHPYKILDLKEYCSSCILESCAIELIEHQIIIVCIYRSPKNNIDSLTSFFYNFDGILSKVCLNSKKKVLICGDFNIDILKNTKISMQFQNLLHSFNMKLGVREPTRLESNTCIDNIIHNVRGSVCEVVELAVSDHTAQIIKCPVKKTCTITHWFSYKRDFCQENVKKFEEALQSLSFGSVYSCKDPNNAFKEFHNLFKLFYDLYFPLKKIKNVTTKPQKWITKGIKLCSKRKREMLWTFRRHPNIVNKQRYNSYSKRLKTIIKLTQKSQNSHFINNAVNKTKATWRVINSSKNNIPRNSSYKLLIDDKYETNPTDIVELFNNHFIDQIKPTNNSDHKITVTNSNMNSLFLSPTTPIDIYKIITTLKNTNSSGFDDIETKIIKSVAVEISPVFSFITNLCIEHGVFPEDLKLSVIKPLHKKGDPQNIQNYRPIALLSIFSKIIEKVIYNSIYMFLEKNDILTKEQYGFRKCKNINMAIYELINEIVTNMDQKIPVTALFMDMTKAFDFVDHGILLNKLYKYGIRGNVLNLIKSYLTGRKQVTSISAVDAQTKTEINYQSRERHIYYGVPQGSVLGPLLFLCYINDLPKTIPHPMTLFADDCTVVFSGKNKDSYENDINSSLSLIIQWLNNNNLQINFNKTQIMTFKQRTNPENLDINYDQNRIIKTEQTKFLGIWLDENMTWKTHMETMIKKINQFCYALHNLNKVANRNTVLTAYHAYVSTTLRYGIIFWGNSTNREMAFKAQKQCLRAICLLKPTESCKPFFVGLKILTLPSLYIHEISIFVKENQSKFEKLKTRRHQNTLKSKKHNTALFSKSCLGMGPKIYNNLPKTLKSMTNINHFKSQLKKFLIEKAYYSINEFLDDKSI